MGILPQGKHKAFCRVELGSETPGPRSMALPVTLDHCPKEQLSQTRLFVTSPIFFFLVLPFPRGCVTEAKVSLPFSSGLMSLLCGAGLMHLLHPFVKR